MTDRGYFRPIETHPTDGTEVLIYRPGWDYAPVAVWEWVEGPPDGFCLWHFKDDTLGAMGDGILWPEEESTPTLWAPLPKEE
jgi:hypothetical protein